MEGNIRLSATVISCMGNDSDKDDFYFNGNFSNCHNTQSIQCSFEKSSNNYIFAISDSMGLENGESGGISAIREIKKYHESAKNHQFILENITERIYEAVQLSSNLIYSKSVVASQNSSILTGFSSLIIDNNRAVIMNLGNNGVFLYRQGQQKDIFARTGGRKSEKLKMLGISTNTPDLYNDTEKLLKLAEEESKTKIKLSSSFEIEEGDIIILCSDGLLNGTSKSRIETVVDSGLEPSKMASVLFQEASKNGFDDGMTVMAIRVDEIRNAGAVSGQRRISQMEMDFYNEDGEEQEEEKKGSNVVNYILGFICVLVISGVLFMGYLIARNSGFFGSGGAAEQSQTGMSTSTGTDQSAISTDDAGASGDSLSGDADASSGGGSNDPGNSQDSNDASDSSGQVTGTDGNQPSDSEYDTYVVKAGDTLSAISNKYYGTPGKYQTIMKYNNIKDENSLFVGQELKIPKEN